ncbi:ABC transporter ATP-binding protein [Streptococcus pneumoniae]|nr:ABC transporter ATP-binding protein [Streptococcus pneumoniae]
MSEIEIINAKKIYHDVPVIENLNITIPKEVSLPFLELQDVGKRPFFV